MFADESSSTSPSSDEKKADVTEGSGSGEEEKDESVISSLFHHNHTFSHEPGRLSHYYMFMTPNSFQLLLSVSDHYIYVLRNPVSNENVCS